MHLTQKDFEIQSLGECKFESPLKLSTVDGDNLTNYVKEDERILYSCYLKDIQEDIKEGRDPLSFEKAGPRKKIFFNPSETKAAIVTCGGLCPGINDVVRGLVMNLHYQYGIKSIYGFKYGYLGLIRESGLTPTVLRPDYISEIHEQGGSILGSSRGNQDVAKIVDRLMDFDINILFTIGGDGTLRGAKEITEEINKRGLPIAVVGVPKTIDNDIGFLERTFGFETACSNAVEAIRGAHAEAKGYQNGVGLVRLMGRQSGSIAAHASIASQDVNFCLIPEMDFDLEGEKGFYHHLLERVKRKGHAVVVVAEGLGEKFCKTDEKDASGNTKSGDIGPFLKAGIIKYFKDNNTPLSMKYIDPSYMIRSSPAIPSDSVFCNQLAQHAVHAAMAGKTGCVAGIWSNSFTYVPIDIAIRSRKFVDMESQLWLNVLEATGQPKFMLNDK